MKKLVINIPRRTDRKKLFLKNNLDKIKDFEWLEAVDGRELTHQKLLDMGFDTDKKYRCIYGARDKKLVRGEVGCFLSHKKAWDIVAQQDEPMMILEDDAIILENYDEEYYERLAEEYNCIYLDYVEWEPSKIVKIDEKIHIPSFPHHLTAYILTPESARILGNEEIMQNIISADEYVPLMLKRLSPCALTNTSVLQELMANTATDIQKYIGDEWFIDFKVHPININEHNITSQIDIHNLIKSYIKDLPDHDVVLMNNSVDISLYDLDTVVRVYLEFWKAIVFSAGRLCFPDVSLSSAFDNYPRMRASEYTGNSYLNLDYFMAEVGELRKLFAQIEKLSNENTSDEDIILLYQEMFLSRKYDIALDYEKKIL